MNVVFPKILFVQVMFVAVLLSCSYQANASELPIKKILILHAQMGSNWEVQTDNAFRKQLDLHFGDEAQLMVEHMTGSDFNRLIATEELVDYYRIKYPPGLLNVIVFAGEPSVRFYLDEGRDVFKDIPAILVLNDRSKLHTRLKEDDGVVIEWSEDPKSTLELGKALFPGSSKIVVLHGLANYDITISKPFIEKIKENAGAMQVEVVAGLSIDDVGSYVSQLSDDVLVFPLLSELDSQGNIHSFTDFFYATVNASYQPHLSLWEDFTKVPFGVGVVVNSDVLGKTMGDITKQFIDGASVASIGSVRIINVPMVHWELLKKWNIPLAKLPEGTIIVDREYTFFETHRWAVISVSFLVILQTILILILLLNRRALIKIDSDLKLAVKDLRSSESRIRKLIDDSPNGIYVRRGDHYLLVNQNLSQMLGYSSEELLNKDFSILELVPEDLKERIGEEFLAPLGNSAALVPKQTQVVTKSGVRIDIEFVANTIEWDGEEALLGFMRDVTEQRKLESQLMRAQKLDAIGRLAGGVAHDFNNLMTVIMGSSEMAMMYLDDKDLLKSRLNEILQTTDRAASLTRKLLTFSKKQVVEPRPLDIAAVLTDLEKMLSRLIGEDINLAVNVADDLNAIEADPTQIEQIIVNLIVNSRDAMPLGGKLTITATNTKSIEEKKSSDEESLNGCYVKLVVKDSGAGMTEEVKNHLYEPFFTTKDEIGGTGLGLSTVYGIIQSYDGAIFVKSEIDVGTTFTIYIPALEHKISKDNKSNSEAATSGGNETILLVEDEEIVRKMVSSVLGRYGYTVISADAAIKGVEIFKANPELFDMVLTDVIMPEMNGATMVDKMRSDAPRLKVLFMSGHSDNAIADKGVLLPGLHFLSKPFHSQTLARKIREVLDS